MFPFQDFFDRFCQKTGLSLCLSFIMPEGFETAFACYDQSLKTVFVNKDLLAALPPCEQAFHFFHELRHAKQYQQPELFSEEIRRALPYIIQYDGRCFKWTGENYLECRLDGDEAFFTSLYKGQAYELDANRYALRQCKRLFGESKELSEIYALFMPDEAFDATVYDSVYALIDRKTSLEC